MTTNSALLIAFLAAAMPLSAQTVSRTFSKTFNTENKGTITLDLPGAVDLKVWEGATVRIEISVSLPSGNSGMLNELATVGRYNLVAAPTGDALLISAPNMVKQVRVKGTEIKETLTFVVFVPKDLKIQTTNEILAVAKKSDPVQLVSINTRIARVTCCHLGDLL